MNAITKPLFYISISVCLLLFTITIIANIPRWLKQAEQNVVEEIFVSGDSCWPIYRPIDGSGHFFFPCK